MAPEDPMTYDSISSNDYAQEAKDESLGIGTLTSTPSDLLTTLKILSAK